MGTTTTPMLHARNARGEHDANARALDACVPRRMGDAGAMASPESCGPLPLSIVLRVMCNICC